MEGVATPCHLTAKVGVAVLISTFFNFLRFGTETLMFGRDTAFFNKLMLYSDSPLP